MIVSVNVQGQAGKWPRKGFSVLELLIALGLLGTLLALAWSILGSYRSAQQRGWDQTYRLQVAAAARELLEEDALQCEGDFEGFERGFSVTKAASIDSLPWIEYVLAGDSDVEQTLDASDLYRQTTSSPQAELGQATKVYPNPQGNLVRLSYALEPMTSAESQTPTMMVGSPESVWQLVRSVQSLNSLEGSSQNEAESVAASERVLSSTDLYRLTEDEQMQEGSGPATHHLRGLVSPRFRYFDGQQWRTSWNSDFQNGLPKAIELSFDYPIARSPDAVQPSDDQPGLNAASDSSPQTQAVLEPLEARMETETEEPVRDVRIVVLYSGSSVTMVSDEKPLTGAAQ